MYATTTTTTRPKLVSMKEESHTKSKRKNRLRMIPSTELAHKIQVDSEREYMGLGLIKL